jgi:hypothetical protein
MSWGQIGRAEKRWRYRSFDEARFTGQIESLG